MRPCLILIVVTTCLASPFAYAQHPGSHAASPATALAARPVVAGTPTSTTARSQSSFGRAMAELTRAAREPKPAVRADSVNTRSEDAPAAIVPKGPERGAVVVTSTRSDP